MSETWQWFSYSVTPPENRQQQQWTKQQVKKPNMHLYFCFRTNQIRQTNKKQQNRRDESTKSSGRGRTLEGE